MGRFVKRGRGRRRFGRSSRVSGVRRARRVLKRVKRVRRKKQLRRKKRKQYFLGFSGASHNHCAAGVIQITDPDPANNIRSGLFAHDDINEILQQVKVVEDVIYNNTHQGVYHNRTSLRAYARGTQTWTISNNNQAGACWLEVYICKPRRGIPTAGIGPTNLLRAADVINANLNQLFQPDYNDASSFSVNAAGTGGVTNIMQNAQVQTKPTVGQDQYCVTPYMVPLFTENWKVVKHLKYVLPAGGQCMVQLKSKALLDRNQLRKGTGFGTAAADYNIHRPSYGREVFFRFHGQPVHDSASHTLVNYGSVALDCVMTKKYWYSSVQGTHVPTYALGGIINQGTITAAKLPALPTEEVKETD